MRSFGKYPNQNTKPYEEGHVRQAQTANALRMAGCSNQSIFHLSDNSRQMAAVQRVFATDFNPPYRVDRLGELYAMSPDGCWYCVDGLMVTEDAKQSLPFQEPVRGMIRYVRNKKQ